MSKCEFCGVEVELPFECNFCGGYFCMEHRLPENHNCLSAPARTPLGHWKSKRTSSEKLPKGKEVEVITSEGNYHFEKQKLITYDLPKKQKNKVKTDEREPVMTSEGNYHFENKELSKDKLREEMKEKSVKVEERESSKLGQLLHVNRRSKNLLLSLKLWFIILWAIVGLIFLIEKDNPVQFYHSIPDPIRYTLYIFAFGIGIWSAYGVFEKCDYNPRSDRGIFALKLLSAGIFVLAVFTLVSSVFFLSGLFTQNQWGLFIEPQVSLSREIISVFLIVLSFALIILSAYLLFKFERRSGIIVYRR